MFIRNHNAKGSSSRRRSSLPVLDSKLESSCEPFESPQSERAPRANGDAGQTTASREAREFGVVPASEWFEAPSHQE